MAAHAPQELIRFHDALAREIREGLSGVEAFEIAEGITPHFNTYYQHWRADEARLRRTMNGALARRSHLPAFVDRLKRDFGPRPKVLEVGSGYGSDALLLTSLGCEVVGVDPAPHMVKVASHRASYWADQLGMEPPRFVLGRIENLQEFELGSFDGVFSAECLHHCEPVEATLLAMRGLVREDGCGLVLESNGRCLANELVLLRQRRPSRRRRLRRDSGGYWLYGDENIRGTSAWRRLFGLCGFDVERVWYSRHLASELMSGSPAAEERLVRLPGKSFATIHTTYELTPRPL